MPTIDLRGAPTQPPLPAHVRAPSIPHYDVVSFVHRDLKPANVIVEVTDEGAVQAFVVDFGLAIDVESGGLTVSGTMVGTPAFMSPEQARGDLRAVDRRSDVYSLGATLYAALAGRAPFQAEGVFEVMRKVGSAP